MNHRRSVLSCAAALSVPLAWVGTFASIAQAQQRPAIPPPLVQPEHLAPPIAEPSDTSDEVPLGHPYESLSAGITFRPPADSKMAGTISSMYIAEWSDPARDWTLKLGRMTLDRPAPLVTIQSNFAADVEGILDRTAKNLQTTLPGSILLRKDVTNTRDGGRPDPDHPEFRNNVGMIAIRYSKDGRRRLSQQAIIKTNDSVYYLLTLTSPGSSSLVSGPPFDPAEMMAADTFGRMLDTVRLLDRTAIKRDQDDRLFHSRTALVNWTADKLHGTLITEQWLRILKNGKDIGYSYITEETSGGIPKPLKVAQLRENEERVRAQPIKPQDLKPKGDGILIGVRSRMMVDGIRPDKTRGQIQTDSAFWFYTTIDRKHEDFSRVVVTDDFKAPKKGFLQEFGVSDKRVKRFVERPNEENNPNGAIVPNKDNVIISSRDDWELDVNEFSNYGAAEPLTRKLPTFYLPQALSHLLPRLLPLDRPQGYLFATYISDAREVVLRYVDVMPEQMVAFNGSHERAIPIRDRLGLEGSPTFHYMTIEGRYLGSENKEQKLVMLPTDAEMLAQIWKDANLTRPGGVDRGGPANADAVNPQH